MIGSRREINGIVTVAALLLMIAAVFPYGAIVFRASAVPRKPAAFSFVTLTPSEEAAAMSAARTSWQTDRANQRYQRIDLFGGDLPEFPHGPVAVRPVVSLRFADPHFQFKPKAFPLTRGAPPPSAMSAMEPFAPTPAFSRQELLTID